MGAVPPAQIENMMSVRISPRNEEADRTGKFGTEAVFVIFDLACRFDHPKHPIYTGMASTAGKFRDSKRSVKGVFQVVVSNSRFERVCCVEPASARPGRCFLLVGSAPRNLLQIASSFRELPIGCPVSVAIALEEFPVGGGRNVPGSDPEQRVGVERTLGCGHRRAG